jgi:hypothetical protein
MIIDPKQKVTNRLNIEPKRDEKGNWLYDGLCPVTLTEVRLVEQEYEKGEFANKSVMSLAFEFVNIKANVNDPERYLTHVEKIVGTQEGKGDNATTMSDEKIGKIITNMWSRIKHIMDNLIMSPNYRDISTISDKDIKKYMDLPTSGTVDERIAAFNTFFTYICNYINGEGDKIKSMLLDKDGKFLNFWLILLPDYNSGKFYTIPTFVGTGFMESLKIDEKGKLLLPKIIHIKPTQSLELANNSRQPANMSGMPNLNLPNPGGLPQNIMDLMQSAQ